LTVSQDESEQETGDADRAAAEEPLQLLAVLARRAAIADDLPEHPRQAEGRVHDELNVLEAA
jgi:hypothetical protein